MSARLAVHDLSRSFHGRRVVNGLSFAVNPGEIVGLLGPNGAGKTTCFGMIAGLVAPDTGTVHLNGRSLDGMPLWRRSREGLGYLAQGATVFRALSVRENLEMLKPRVSKATVSPDTLLARVGLLARAGDRAATLSGGERRRLEFARLLMTGPDYVLLDEPFSGVDPLGVQELQVLVRAMASAGAGVLLTDHAVREALGVCDRAIIIDSGSMVIAGTPAEVAADSHVLNRYLGSSFSLDKAQFPSD
jgi:lipopolysaccharide export system ATP-binding protein